MISYMISNEILCLFMNALDFLRFHKDSFDFLCFLKFLTNS